MNNQYGTLTEQQRLERVITHLRPYNLKAATLLQTAGFDYLCKSTYLVMAFTLGILVSI